MFKIFNYVRLFVCEEMQKIIIEDCTIPILRRNALITEHICHEPRLGLIVLDKTSVQIEQFNLLFKSFSVWPVWRRVWNVISHARDQNWFLFFFEPLHHSRDIESRMIACTFLHNLCSFLLSSANTAQFRISRRRHLFFAAVHCKKSQLLIHARIP